MFMCQGRCVYHGAPEGVVAHFSAYGYRCELHDNPADYALDVLIQVGQKPVLLADLDARYQRGRDAYQLNYLIPNEKVERHRRKFRVVAARSWKAQLVCLSKRAMRNAIRNPSLALSQTLVSVIIGLLVGLLFLNLEKTVGPGVQNRLGAIFFIIISQVFSTVTAIEPLVQERALFIHVRENQLKF